MQRYSTTAFTIFTLALQTWQQHRHFPVGIAIKNFPRSQQSEDFGASLGFPFKGIPAKLGFDSSSQSWSKWYSNFCSKVQQSQSLKSSVRDYVKTVNQGIVNAFTQCTSSVGLHVWLERTGDPKVFRFAAKFNPPNSQNSSVMIKRFDPGDNVACSEQPKEVDAAEWRTRCKRLDDGQVSFIVNANWIPIGGGDLSLPEIPAPPSERFRYSPPVALPIECAIKETLEPLAVPRNGSKTWECPALASGKYKVSFWTTGESPGGNGARVSYTIDLETGSGQKIPLQSIGSADISVPPPRAAGLFPPDFSASDQLVDLPEGPVLIRFSITGMARWPAGNADMGPVQLAKSANIDLKRFQ